MFFIQRIISASYYNSWFNVKMKCVAEVKMTTNDFILHKFVTQEKVFFHLATSFDGSFFLNILTSIIKGWKSTLITISFLTK